MWRTSPWVVLLALAACAGSEGVPANAGGAGGGPTAPEFGAGTGGGAGLDAGEWDAGSPPTWDAGSDSDAGPGLDAGSGEEDGGGDGGCFLDTIGVFGQCLSTATCAGLGDDVSTPGYCPGPADIECCTPAPNVADNPPVPMGWRPMQQSAVTAAMTDWAVAILDAPVTYPMFSTVVQTFEAQQALARVEWHPPDFQNSAVHRGVTLYVPAA